VFWFTILVGLALTLLVAAISPLVAAFYGDPLLRPITAAIGLTFILSAPASVPNALLQKALRFKQIASVQVAATLLSSAAAIALALRGAGVWSLVVQSLLGAAASSLLVFVVSDWRPRWALDFRSLKDLLRYGAGLTGFNVLNYWSRSADNLLVGKFLGATALGIYSRAYSLMVLPLMQVIGVLQPALFPALAEIQHDTERVRRAYLRANRLITFVTFPAMFGLLAVADPFVNGLLGSAWAGVIPLIQILAMAGLLNTVANPTGWLFQSQGRTDWMFRWSLFASSARVLGFCIGVWIGTVEAVAWSYTIGGIFLTPLVVALAGRLVNLSVSHVVAATGGNFLRSALMAAIVSALSLSVPQGIDGIPRLTLLVAAGVLTYFSAAWWTRAEAIADALSVLKQTRPLLAARLDRLRRA
jgi:PST family polysaccharide transporter